MSEKKKQTLSNEEITTGNALGRRSALGLIGGLGVAGAVAGTLGMTQQAHAERPCTDSDSGPNADGQGHGHGNGTSDSDSGPNSDPAGCGRGGGHK